jgi:DJ-1 family protein
MKISTPQVVIPLAAGCEEMEVVICADILRRAGAEVSLAGIDGDAAVTASRGVVLLPDCSWEARRQAPMDLLLLPGGAGGVERLRQCSSLLTLLRERMRNAAPVAAICAAPSLLAGQGLLAGKRVTGYPGTLDAASAEYRYCSDPVVVDGSLTTSRGPGTAIDFALQLVAQLFTVERRAEVEKALQRPAVYLSSFPVDNGPVQSN